MRAPAVDTIDFETFKIEPRPDYPPEPVGVSIKEPGKRSRYYAWGHPTKNNCTKAEAVKVLKSIWCNGRPKLFHNAKFDVDVATTHMDVTMLPWHMIHDTQFLAFLDNPHSKTLSLKPLSDELLDMPAEEQDELHGWILDHVFTSFKSGEGSVVVASKRPEGFFKIPPSKAGAFIAYAPGDLVGRYAKGDTDRTYKLFRLMYSDIVPRGMKEAYEREQRLMPVLLKSENNGIAIHHKKLKADVAKWEESVEIVDQWIRNRLKVKELDIDSNNELADAIENVGKVDAWILTEKGNRSVAGDNIKQCLTDKQLLAALEYRALLTNALRNFGRPWLEMAGRTGGFIHTSWNQVRTTTERSSGNKGARTGRLSSTPNFQNIPKKPEQIKLPKWLADKVISLPYMREYIKPRKGHVLINRDYSQQELRILGHYEDGVLLDEYSKNPFIDFHDLAQHKVNQMLNANFPRKPIKNMGFGLIYGMGIAKLADSMGTDMDMAKVIKKAYLDIFPGIKDLIDDLMDRFKNGESLHTWGGREYYVEPKQWDKKKDQWRSFEYKALNVLIQGSAADCSKEAMIRTDEICTDSILLMNVHDEIMLDSPSALYKQEMDKMREAMESIEFDIPMLSDGKYSRTSWGKMTAYKDRR